MEVTKVIIENLPKTPWYKEWMPIIIAIIALVMSIISLYWTRKEYIKSNRPFVWASNYGVIDAENKTIIPIPFRIGCRVKNSPARILQMEVSVILNKSILFTHAEKNFVRFPDETSEWSFSIGKDEYEKIMNRSDGEKSNLKRIISIVYSSLDGGKIYHYRLEQLFIKAENQWEGVLQKAD